jgi:hypothetical protein
MNESSFFDVSQNNIPEVLFAGENDYRSR